LTHYQRGANFERKVKEYYESEGYYVIRSAGSHGVADLVCIRRLKRISHPEIILVQCKLYGDWDKKQNIIRLAKKLHVNAVYAYNKRGKIILEPLV
jgi:Holliday junction resolvase